MSQLPPPPPGSPLGAGSADWLRLDRRMLLIHPVQELVKFLPALVGVAIAGGAGGLGPWSLIAIAVPVALGIARYLTTAYRIHDGRIELRRGILQRRTTSARLERVRTVDVSATLWHRVLSLATLTVGTGSVGTDEDERLTLDGLPRAAASALRADLLSGLRAPTASPSLSTATSPAFDAAAPPQAPPAEFEVVRFRPRWLLYAPFTSTGLIAAAALLGIAAQGVETLGVRLRFDGSDLPALTGVLILALVLIVLLTGLVLAVAGYVVTNWDFRLARSGGSWHVRRGLLTTRETSLDEKRVAGVSVGEPAVLRGVHGGHLNAIVTGADSSGASTVLVPTAPAAAVHHAAATVLGRTQPLDGPLRPHGSAATRRRLTRAFNSTLPLIAIVAGAAWWAGTWWPVGLVPVLLAAALFVGVDRARGLGHAWSDGFVVMRSGSIARRRTALADEHIIGWNLTDSWFQRRVGLVSVAATTAGASGSTAVYDVPTADAYSLAEQATPGLLGQFHR